jgi:hypothetical protein
VAGSGRCSLLVLAVTASSGSCVGSSAWSLSVVGGTKCREGFSGESLALGANDDDACGCHDPLEGVVAATLSALVLRVKAQRPWSR